MATESESGMDFWTNLLKTLLDSVLDKIGAIFPWLRHWLNRPVILRHQRDNWWHMGGKGGQPAMQMVSYWYVTNRTDKPIMILNTYLRPTGTFGHVLTKDVHSVFHGSYPVPPHTTTELHADFWLQPLQCREGKDFRTDIVFVDQNGQKRTIRNVLFKSDKKKKAEPIKPREERIFELEHDVEKKIAAVLKDEISRYKKFGRQSGQLGSVYALYNGKKIKSIYQDSWTDSKSGERQEIVSDLDNAKIKSENGDALVEHFKKLRKRADKDLFVDSLLSRLGRNTEYYCVSYLILYVLFRIERLEAALAAAKISLPTRKTWWGRFLGRVPDDNRLETHQRNGFSDFLGLINGLLRYEHPFFKNAELDLIEEFITGIDEYSFRIAEKINSARAFRING